MTVPSTSTAHGERLLTPRFLTVVASGLAYFLSLGMLLPVVPLYIAGPLGGSELAVGVVVGAFAAGAVVVRPWAGRVGDRQGRRLLIVSGALIVAASVVAYHPVSAVAALFFIRLFGGIGEAAFFVGAGTMATDLAPVSRRGEAISYWSIAVYGGLAFGPSLGEFLLDGDRFELVWTVSATLALVAALIGLCTRETAVRHDPSPDPAGVSVPRPAPSPLINRTAVGPGVVLFLGIIGLAGFFAFVPLYVSDIDMADSSGVFLLYGCTVLAVRIFGARIPDRVGPLRAGTAATVASAAGLVVIAAVQTPTGLYLGTFVFSIGMSLMYPAMLMLALTGVPENERGSAVGTVSSFFDLSQGLGAAILGAAVALTGYRGAFLTAAGLALLGTVLLRSGIDRRAHGEIDHAAAELARQHVEPEPP
jgi:MFS family permease